MATETPNEPVAADSLPIQHEHEDDTPKPVALVAAGSGAIVRRGLEGLMPTSIGEAFMLSTYLAKSNAIPSGFNGKPESVLTVIMAGMEVGLTPIRSLQSISNIQGNLCMKADLQLALVRRSGLLALYDEGFELRGKTEDTLPDRMLFAFDGHAELAAAYAQQVLALTDAVPAGKPYGWCIMARKGDKARVQVFTWVDADRVKAKDDGGEMKSLAEKHNYKNYPQDMYPKRARSRLIAVLFGDVVAGLPSQEALGDGQVIDAQFTSGDDGNRITGEDTVNGILNALPEDTAKSVRLAFTNLDLSTTRQLVTLRKYAGDPEALLRHLRDEYARRGGAVGAGPAKPAETTAAAASNESAKPEVASKRSRGPRAQPAPVMPAEEAAARGVLQPPAPEPPAPAQDPGRQIPEGGPATSRAKTTADKFRKRF